MTFRPLITVPQSRNVTVVARLAHGVVLPPVWPLPLDGVLESFARRAQLGEAYGAGRELTPEQHQWVATSEGRDGRENGRRPTWLAEADRQFRRPRIPLARYSQRVASQWFWLASCATWDGDHADLRYWHRRFGHEAAERVCGEKLPSMVYEAHGRYRSYRVPLVVTLAAELRWRCLADPERLLELCQTIDQLGKKWAQGEGRVLSWNVIDEGPPDPTWAIWTEDGHIARPVPVRLAAELGITDPHTMPGAIRPPYHVPPQTERTEGGFARQWRDVLSPTTRRPGTV